MTLVDNEATIVFPDTNVFMHSRWRDFDWCSLAATDRVEVWLASQVIAELDDHKNYQQRDYLRQRAESTLRELEAKLTNGEELAPHVRIRLAPPPPEHVFREYGLNTTEKDDRIIASALSQKAASSAPIYLISGDTGPRLKAKPLGIQVLSPPEKHRILPQLDERDAEIRKLRDELVREKSARPKLQLALTKLSEDQLDSLLIPHTPSPFVHPAPAERARDMLFQSHPGLQSSDYADDRARRQHYDDTQRHAEFLSRTATVALTLDNEGSAVASDIVIELRTQGRFSFASRIPEFPRDPNNSDSFGGIDEIEAIYRRQREALAPAPNASLSIESPASPSVAVFRVRRAQHGVPVALPWFFVTYAAHADVRPIRFSYRILASELPSAYTGELSILYDASYSNPYEQRE